MTKSPTVSVALVAYNHEKFVAEAIESVLMQQTNFDVEIVVGEDCSADGTREILLELQRKHPDQIRLLLHEQNIGASRNFADTFAACRGKYIATLDGDDYWTFPDKLQRQVDAMESHPNWVACAHKALKTNDGASHVIPGFEPNLESTLRDVLDQNFAPSCTTLYRSGVINGFPDAYHSDIAGDWFLLMMFARLGPIGFLSDVMATYRVHSGGIYGGRSDVERILFQIHTIETMLPMLDGKHKPLARAAISDRRLQLGRFLRENGNLLGAMCQLVQSFGQHPFRWRTFSHDRLCAATLLLTPGFVLRYIRHAGGGMAITDALRRRFLPRWTPR